MKGKNERREFSLSFWTYGFLWLEQLFVSSDNGYFTDCDLVVMNSALRIGSGDLWLRCA